MKLAKRILMPLLLVFLAVLVTTPEAQAATSGTSTSQTVSGTLTLTNNDIFPVTGYENEYTGGVKFLDPPQTIKEGETVTIHYTANLNDTDPTDSSLFMPIGYDMLAATVSSPTTITFSIQGRTGNPCNKVANVTGKTVDPVTYSLQSPMCG